MVGASETLQTLYRYAKRLEADVAAEYWWNEWLGVYLSYRVEREETDPGATYVRHVVSIGSAGRIRHGTD